MYRQSYARITLSIKMAKLYKLISVDKEENFVKQLFAM